VILLDATALIALLTGERAASAVEALLRDEDVAIASVNLAETIDILVRVFGFDVDAVDTIIVPLPAVNLGVVPIGEEEARRGASVRATHYHRTRMPLSPADCLLISTASLLWQRSQRAMRSWLK
jgi:PIN domain nuclease of toxin-antitoxin system